MLSLVNYSLLTKSWVGTIYHFTVVFLPYSVFAIAIYSHPGLIFAGKALSLPLEWNPIRSSTMAVANTLAYYDTAIISMVKKFQTTGYWFYN